MKKIIILVLFLLALPFVYSQDNDIKEIKEKILQLEKEIKSAVNLINLNNTESKNNFIELKKITDSLKIQLESTKKSLDSFENDLLGNKVKIDNIDEKSTKEISRIDEKTSNSVYLWSIAIVILLSVLIIIYFIIKKKIRKTSVSFEEKTVDLDKKLADLMQSQLAFQKAEIERSKKKEEEIDHSLALRVGEEIHRMRKRIENMDSETKGLNALKGSLRRLEDEFNGQGYQIIELLGIQFDDNMKTIPKNFIPMENIEKGQKIIVNVIKPKISYKDIIISYGEVEVGVNESDLK